MVLCTGSCANQAKPESNIDEVVKTVAILNNQLSDLAIHIRRNGLSDTEDNNQSFRSMFMKTLTELDTRTIERLDAIQGKLEDITEMEAIFCRNATVFLNLLTDAALSHPVV